MEPDLDARAGPGHLDRCWLSLRDRVSLRNPSAQVSTR